MSTDAVSGNVMSIVVDQERTECCALPDQLQLSHQQYSSSQGILELNRWVLGDDPNCIGLAHRPPFQAQAISYFRSEYR